MLSAEHMALEHQAVQQLLGIRHQEVSYMTDRFNAIGTQSSLLAGFIVTTLTAVSAADPGTTEWVRQTFWASSALSLMFSLHCVLCSTFAAVWGPGLALRGPTGSVSKAYFNMVRERQHIMISYVLSLLFFVVQSIMAFYILDEKLGLSASSLTATLILGLGSVVSALFLGRMGRRFFYRETILSSLNPDSRASENVFQTQDPDQIVEELLMTGEVDDEAKVIQASEDDGDSLEKPLLPHASPAQASSQGESKSQTTRRRSKKTRKNNGQQVFSHQGYLWKKGHISGLFNLNNQWKRRYFRLINTKLFYWKDEEEYQDYLRTPVRQRNKPDSIDLKGFQVLVKPAGPNMHTNIFVLEGLADHTRDREFKAASEDELRGWVQSLLAATVVAQ